MEKKRKKKLVAKKSAKIKTKKPLMDDYVYIKPNPEYEDDFEIRVKHGFDDFVKRSESVRKEQRRKNLGYLYLLVALGAFLFSALIGSVITAWLSVLLMIITVFIIREEKKNKCCERC